MTTHRWVMHFRVQAGRSLKGQLVEDIARKIVSSAWRDAGGDLARLKFKNHKTQIKANQDHIEQLPEFVRDDILEGKVYYDISVDVQIYIDDVFVMGIECKSYTENAMLKRILVDFWLLQKLHPKLKCCLLQLETFLGGDNAKPGANVANHSTYTLMSYFPDVNLTILTLLEGARDIERPIHKREFFKEMSTENVKHVTEKIRGLLSCHVEN